MGKFMVLKLQKELLEQKELVLLHRDIQVFWQKLRVLSYLFKANLFKH